MRTNITQEPRATMNGCVLVANGAAGRMRAKSPGHKRQVASWRGRWQGNEQRTALSRVCSRLGIQRRIDSSMMGQ